MNYKLKVLSIFMVSLTSFQLFGMCIKSKKTCKLVYSRPWSKDLGNQCTYNRYICEERFCDGSVISTAEDRKTCDPITCKPYEDYDPSLKCCIKSNIKWRKYKDQQIADLKDRPERSLARRWTLSLKSIEQNAGGQLIKISDKNRNFCHNNNGSIGDICLMTYHNARFYCDSIGAKLPSVKNFANFGLKTKEYLVSRSKWQPIPLYISGPKKSFGEDISYEFEGTTAMNFVNQELHQGLWVNEYCYGSHKESFNENGDQIISLCKYYPSNGSFHYGISFIETAPVMCNEN